MMGHVKLAERIYGRTHRRACAALVELADGYLQLGQYEDARRTTYDFISRASYCHYTVRVWMWLFGLLRLARMSKSLQKWDDERRFLRQTMNIAKQIADAKDELSLQYLTELKQTVEQPWIFGPGAFDIDALSKEAPYWRQKAEDEHVPGFVPILFPPDHVPKVRVFEEEDFTKMPRRESEKPQKG